MTTIGLEGPALIVAGRTAASLLAETWRATLGEANILHSVHLLTTTPTGNSLNVCCAT